MIAAGTKLGPYEILAALSTGGMGEVYRARDTKLGRDVAVKVLPSSLSADADRLHRFEQEACAAGALNHPNILVIHHIDTHDGAPYIVSELLEGETLRQRMNGATLAHRRVIDYATQIGHGLAAAHEKGIVHRDLKPDNNFITKDGRLNSRFWAGKTYATRWQPVADPNTNATCGHQSRCGHGHHLGWHYMNTHQYDLAINQLQKALEIDPNFGIAHWYLGLCYEQKGKYAEAEGELRKAQNLLRKTKRLQETSAMYMRFQEEKIRRSKS
jgi:serine/threonine protein kinase